MHFISTSDLLGLEWNFLASVCDDPRQTWETHSGLPKTALERLIRRPNLARWRAALTEALARVAGRMSCLCHNCRRWPPR